MTMRNVVPVTAVTISCAYFSISAPASVQQQEGVSVVLPSEPAEGQPSEGEPVAPDRMRLETSPSATQNNERCLSDADEDRKSTSGMNPPDSGHRPERAEQFAGDGSSAVPATATDSLWLQLALGLTVAAIQIAITVLFVDRGIARREARRIRPTQNQIYARIFDALDGLLFHILPAQARKTSHAVVRFGMARAYLTCDVDEGALESEKGPREWRREDLPVADLQPALKTAKDGIAHVLQFASPLLPSTVLAKLLQIESLLDVMDDHVTAREDIRWDVCEDIIVVIMELRGHLLTLAEESNEPQQYGAYSR